MTPAAVRWCHPDLSPAQHVIARAFHPARKPCDSDLRRSPASALTDTIASLGRHPTAPEPADLRASARALATVNDRA